MKLAFIIICSPQPQQFAEMLQRIFGGTSRHEFDYWVWEVCDLPAVRIKTGNAGDPEKYYLSLQGSKKEMALKICQHNAALHSHFEADMWKMYTLGGEYLGCIAVMDS